MTSTGLSGHILVLHHGQAIATARFAKQQWSNDHRTDRCFVAPQTFLDVCGNDTERGARSPYAPALF